MKKLLFIFSFLLVVFVVVVSFSYQVVDKQRSGERVLSVTHLVPSEKFVDERKGVPVRLIIPAIQVDASVELVGLDKDGNMDVPKKTENVAWYSLGYRPGEKGNAVIAGHLDTVSGSPAVFYHLGNLQAGDVIQLEDQAGSTFVYTVTKREDYPYDKFPLEEVFGFLEESRLNLITCQGDYNATRKIYSHRTVIFSELTAVKN